MNEWTSVLEDAVKEYMVHWYSLEEKEIIEYMLKNLDRFVCKIIDNNHREYYDGGRLFLTSIRWIDYKDCIGGIKIIRNWLGEK